MSALSVFYKDDGSVDAAVLGRQVLLWSTDPFATTFIHAC
jgi:hypothetical protein